MLWIASTENNTSDVALAARLQKTAAPHNNASGMQPEDSTGGRRKDSSLSLLALANPCAEARFNRLLNRSKTDRFPAVPLSTD